MARCHAELKLCMLVLERSWGEMSTVRLTAVVHSNEVAYTARTEAVDGCMAALCQLRLHRRPMT